ncbi:MAG: hypothetical protein ACLP5H_13040 [Desulfomonilaceae bacterium]
MCPSALLELTEDVAGQLITRINVGWAIDARLKRARFKVVACFHQAVDCECACLRGSLSEAAPTLMKYGSLFGLLVGI